EVCRLLRQRSDIPVLFLSARDEEIDRILGLEMGGDDYVTKPFSPRELVARVNVILRRARPAAAEQVDERRFAHGKLVLVPASHAASFDGRPLVLTGIEFSILRGFLSRPTHVLGRDVVMASAYAANIHVADRTIDSHIRNIRAKLAAAGCADAIETVHGVGFRLGRCGG
ncbi:MAG: winged helix-turn-helix domain-containing protein, partial [Mesorhizobium sp.]|nr:winged helix-turn-helix domain-containing protein [Mesorhizobium sp.]